ncbi:GAF and HD-GYP domain-containing protein [Alloalcanivorax marinus]|uniref:GAF and HD-GYP domain-containing protein n=1 Tax=Alloalcanivorax marinus TaxID=1177169 RepID=UPI001931E2AA|nr:HD family phosphohydrolase [Alloalcanivorax marinus]MBL7250441.1 GAF domain-containing protein [Alloalcanivorax marinus]
MSKLEGVPGTQLPPLLRVARQINVQSDLAPLARTVLKEALGLARAEAGVLWLRREEQHGEWLECAGQALDGEDPGADPGPDQPRLSLDEAGAGHPAARTVHRGGVLHLTGAALDEADHTRLVPGLVTRVVSLLLVPLTNHEGRVVGVLQLVNARGEAGAGPFPVRTRALLEALGGYAGIALNNLMLVQELKDLLDAFVKVFARAIDAKSSHTSAHCERVPLLTELLARAACDDATAFADFQLDEDEWYELRVAAWLHDCGKLAIPDSVLDKATKLHGLHDRIELVAARFSAVRSEVERHYLRDCLESPDREAEHRRRRQEDIDALEADLAFLERINIGGETMAAEDVARVRRIAERPWVDARGETRPLLSDDEVANLCITRGTLTEEERRIINSHMDVTLDMLESLPFPRKLRRVPEYAGGHHERMDGTGFPRGLTREQMSIPARIMAIADVFEALTARERPYKTPLKISEALGIMQRMRDNRHLDPDLYRLFLDAGVWRDYARAALDPEQLDVDDPTPFR